MKRILRNPYVIAGLIVFALLLILGLWLDFSWGEVLLGAVVLTVVGIVSVWWEELF